MGGGLDATDRHGRDVCEFLTQYVEENGDMAESSAECGAGTWAGQPATEGAPLGWPTVLSPRGGVLPALEAHQSPHWGRGAQLATGDRELLTCWPWSSEKPAGRGQGWRAPWCPERGRGACWASGGRRRARPLKGPRPSSTLVRGCSVSLRGTSVQPGEATS